MILNSSRFRRRVEMWCYSPDHFDGPHAMSDRHHCVPINSLPRGPLSPLAVYLTRRIAEHTI